MQVNLNQLSNDELLEILQECDHNMRPEDACDCQLVRDEIDRRKEQDQLVLVEGINYSTEMTI